MSAGGGSSSSDDDDFHFDSAHIGSKRFPVHDCCEYEDAESLRRLIFVPQDDSDNGEDGSDDSSSDDNDSLAAAHAAAIGHSPRPINPLAKVGSELGISLPLGSGANKVEHRAEVNNASTRGEGEDNTGKLDGGELSSEISPNSNDDNGGKAMEIENQTASQSTNETGGTNGDGSSSKIVITSQDETKTRLEENHHRNDITNGAAQTTTNDEDPSPIKVKKRKIIYYSPYDLDERDEDENTPLHVAVHSCKLEHVKLLLEAGASHARKCDGSFPVHTAISMGAISKHADFAHDCLATLAGYGADLSIKDDCFHTPLYLACAMNLPRAVSFILSDSEGMSTLNARADRMGGRPLHAAAKYDIQPSQSTARHTNNPVRPAPHHHPDGTITHSTHHVPGVVAGADVASKPLSLAQKGSAHASDIAPVTEMLLSQSGIEVDAQNVQGHTALHVACSRGNWPVVRLLLNAHASTTIVDKRGFTPGQVAHKRGVPVPNDLMSVLGDRPVSLSILAPPRDLVVDPDSTTFLISHELCMLHRSCPPIRRDTGMDPPPENIRRLHVIINEKDGILRGGEFSRMVWQNHSRRAAISDVLKCHEYEYVEKISQMCAAIPDHPSAIAHLDADTAISRWSFESAMRAAGSVCEAVDKVVNGDHRNAFCAVRPPGHHAGPRGIVRCANDPDGGSHGFCLLNNVAIGAAYARTMFRHEGIKKIAIVDFDVHHGNGTEEIIRQLVPSVERGVVKVPFAFGELESHRYRPWLDETDINDVFFASTHGYGPRGVEFSDIPQQTGWFYPASGKSQVTDALVNPSIIEKPNLNDFMLSQTWARMGEESRFNCCKILNCGLGLPTRDAIPGMQRLELRDTYRKSVLPRLREFDPDIIFISAGFDAHRKDTMNFGYVGMVEDDYEWVTEQIVKVANSCCNGRVVSVLEGGYKVHGGVVSPFARSVASHVRALVDGGSSRELYDPNDCSWESQFERHILEERERKRQQKQERQMKAMEMARRLHDDGEDEEPTRKRRRNQIDYKELYEQMKREEAET